MNILILDPDGRRRQHLLDALAWFESSLSVCEAANQAEADRCLQQTAFDIVLIGPELPMGTLLTVVYLRRRLPQAYLVVCDNISVNRDVSPGHLKAAGSNLIVDERMSPWKIAILLRPFFGGAPVVAAQHDICLPSPA